jgi:poly(hydroxyalkanoate) granule-associated protein
MVTKIRKKGAAKSAAAPVSSSVKDSAQQIWQAGLAAFTRAQVEGSKAFESLVKEGVSIQRKTQAVAEERIVEATSKMSSMASGLGSKATGQWDKLETIFEDRVARSLNKLGVPSAKDVNALIARIDELHLAVQKLSGKAPAHKTTGKTTGKPASAAAKPATKPVTKPGASKKAAAKKAVAAPAAPATPAVAKKTRAKAKAPAADQQP